MAENKKSFVLYCDSYSMVKQLPDDVAGRLLKHIFSYVNDERPVSEELLINVAFEPIKQQLKRDLKKWAGETKDRSDAGKKGMANRWAEHNKTKQSITKDNTVINTITNITDSVSVSDSVSVNENEKKINNNIVERKLKFSSTLEPYLEKYGKDLLNAFYKYWTEQNKSNTKFRQELEKFWDLEKRLNTWVLREKQNYTGGGANGQPAKGKIEQGMETMDRVLKSILVAE